MLFVDGVKTVWFIVLVVEFVSFVGVIETVGTVDSAIDVNVEVELVDMVVSGIAVVVGSMVVVVV